MPLVSAFENSLYFIRNNEVTLILHEKLKIISVYIILLLMGIDEAQESLLARDHYHEKSDLQRRRSTRNYGTASSDSSSQTFNNLQQNNSNHVVIVQNNNNNNNNNPSTEQAEFQLKPVLLWLTMYLGGGTLCFYMTSNQIEGTKTNPFLDALYLCVVTMTTVGYGDLVPKSTVAKLLACFYVFTGMALVGLILNKAADYIVEKQEMLVVKAMHKELDKEFQSNNNSNKAKHKFLVAICTFLVLITVGMIFLSWVEDLDFVDALYCVCSTVTTLGYGDKSFSTGIGRAFAVFWILSSTICLAQCFAYLAEMHTDERQRSLAKMILSRKISRPDLEAADLDGDKSVSAAEFVVYKLKEMGKINDEDVSDVLEWFRKLDVDKSGTLTEADII
ncbi:hypothetical protein HN51_002869 [Arachis hypogaea]|uniref:EF-hand domain-containing protein n=1 Tax=Arachis hypogaea TaxID=3818 RepID=A0A445EL51_ARAHY|nr:two pore potassium channel a [Arachis hypogaea]QHO51120.1 Two-pore potassium channel [Arachis hypogaea]RYR76092.1 hypothetical protein Ahy_A01g000688 [Arachis hypogaea]